MTYFDFLLRSLGPLTRIEVNFGSNFGSRRLTSFEFYSASFNSSYLISYCLFGLSSLRKVLASGCKHSGNCWIES